MMGNTHAIESEIAGYSQIARAKCPEMAKMQLSGESEVTPEPESLGHPTAGATESGKAESPEEAEGAGAHPGSEVASDSGLAEQAISEGRESETTLQTPMAG